MSEYQKDRNLWAAVLVRAVVDASMPEKAKDRREQGYQTFVRRQAREWITEGSEDFRLVCELAGVRPERVQKAFANGGDAAAQLKAYRDATRSEHLNGQDL